jgi:hypothetical protein
MPNTVRLHRVLAMKREKVYRAFIEPDPMVPTWQPGHLQAAPLWQPVGRSGLTVLSNVRFYEGVCQAPLNSDVQWFSGLSPPLCGCHDSVAGACLSLTRVHASCD